MDSTLSFNKPILQQTHVHEHMCTDTHRLKLHSLQPSSNQHTGVQDTHSNCTSWLGPSCQLDSCVCGSDLVFSGMLDARGCVHSGRVNVLLFVDL